MKSKVIRVLIVLILVASLVAPIVKEARAASYLIVGNYDGTDPFGVGALQTWTKMNYLVAGNSCAVTSAADPTLVYTLNNTERNNAHSNGLKYLLNFGGTTNLTAIMASGANRAQLVTNLVTLIGVAGAGNFDGLQIDWEDYTGGSAVVEADYRAFLIALKAALPIDKIVMPCLPADVSYNWLTVSDFSYTDYVVVMCYGGAGALQNGTSYSRFSTLMSAWITNSYPTSKIIVGIPCYSDDASDNFGAYYDVVDHFAPAISTNSISTATADGWAGDNIAVAGGTLYFNGADLATSKANWIITNNFAGAYLYKVNWDYTSGTYSLLDAVYNAFVTPPVSTTGKTYYVAKTGNDSNNGSITSPWLTIQRAVNAVASGDTIYVRAGTYIEQVSIANKHGAADAWITMKPYGSEVVKIDGTGLTFGTIKALVNIYQCDYLDFEGFEIQNVAKTGVGAGLNVTNDNVVHGNLKFVNLKIHDCYGTAMRLVHSYGTLTTQMPNVVVDGCTLYDCDEGADWESDYSNPAITCIGINGLEIKNCTIYNFGMGYATWTGQEGVVIDTLCSNVSVHNNEIYNCRTGVYINSQILPVSNVSVYANKIHDCFDYGIALGSEITAAPMTNVDIYNNIIYHVARTLGDGGTAYGNGGFGVMTYNFTKTFRFINNTLFQNGNALGPRRDISILESSSYNVNCVIRNNIIDSDIADSYSVKYDGYSGGGVTIDHNLLYNSAGAWNASNVAGTNVVTGDPVFTNPAGHVFTLASTSPAIDAGSSISAPTIDYLRIVRPQGTGYDIGAYEYTTYTVPSGSVVTGSISNVTSTSVTFTGTVSSLGTDTSATVSFKYGTTTSYGSETSTVVAYVGTFSITATGLTAGTLYHYQAKMVGTPSGLVSLGDDATFTASIITNTGNNETYQFRNPTFGYQTGTVNIGAQLGARTQQAFQGVALYFLGDESKDQLLEAAWGMLLVLMVSSLVFLGTGNSTIALLSSIPMVILATWVGAFPMVMIWLLVSGIVVYMGYHLFLRGM